MAEWAARRFWTTVTLAEAGDGHAVLLDGRALRTPTKAPLTLPSRALAEAVAAEWAAQGETIDPATMPFTRLSNSAIDRVTPHFDAVAADLAGYGGSDLLCYRAETPAELVARQAAAWDPLLDWAAERFGARLAIGTGIVHVAQPPESLARLAACVHAMTAFELAAFHDLVVLSGSLVIALAAVDGVAIPSDLWACSRIDEDWQAERWGADEDAEALASSRRDEFLRAHRAFVLIRQT